MKTDTAKRDEWLSIPFSDTQSSYLFRSSPVFNIITIAASVLSAVALLGLAAICIIRIRQLNRNEVLGKYPEHAEKKRNILLSASRGCWLIAAVFTLAGLVLNVVDADIYLPAYYRLLKDNPGSWDNQGSFQTWLAVESVALWFMEVICFDMLTLLSTITFLRSRMERYADGVLARHVAEARMYTSLIAMTLGMASFFIMIQWPATGASGWDAIVRGAIYFPLLGPALAFLEISCALNFHIERLWQFRYWCGGGGMTHTLCKFGEDYTEVRVKIPDRNDRRYLSLIELVELEQREEDEARAAALSDRWRQSNY